MEKVCFTHANKYLQRKLRQETKATVERARQADTLCLNLNNLYVARPIELKVGKWLHILPSFVYVEAASCDFYTLPDKCNLLICEGAGRGILTF